MGFKILRTGSPLNCTYCSELDLTSALEVRTRDGLVWFFEFIVTTKRQQFLQNLANNNKFEQ